MARSNKDIIALIAAIDPQAVTTDLKNAELEEMLAYLETAEPAAPGEVAPEAAAPGEVAPEAGPVVWVVAKGKTLTSRRGHLVAGSVVTENLIAGGAGALKVLIAKECVVKK